MRADMFFAATGLSPDQMYGSMSTFSPNETCLSLTESHLLRITRHQKNIPRWFYWRQFEKLVVAEKDQDTVESQHFLRFYDQYVLQRILRHIGPALQCDTRVSLPKNVFSGWTKEELITSLRAFYTFMDDATENSAFFQHMQADWRRHRRPEPND